MEDMNETAGWRLLQGEVAVVVRPLVAVADQKHPATWCVCVCMYPLARGNQGTPEKSYMEVQNVGKFTRVLVTKNMCSRALHREGGREREREGGEL